MTKRPAEDAIGARTRAHTHTRPAPPHVCVRAASRAASRLRLPPAADLTGDDDDAGGGVSNSTGRRVRMRVKAPVVEDVVTLDDEEEEEDEGAGGSDDEAEVSDYEAEARDDVAEAKADVAAAAPRARRARAAPPAGAPSTALHCAARATFAPARAQSR
jgi:hypothetical protein